MRGTLRAQKLTREQENLTENDNNLTEICKNLAAFTDTLKRKTKREAETFILRLLRIIEKKREKNIVIRRFNKIKRLIVSFLSTIKILSTTSLLS